MMHESECYLRLTDSMTYNIHYAPNYPIEDATSLVKELQQIKGHLANLKSMFRSKYKRKQIEFAERYLGAAFEAYMSGQDGSKHLEESLEYVNKSRAKGPPKTDFVAGSDGTIRDAPRPDRS